MTLVIPLKQLKVWQEDEEINCTVSADEYFCNLTKKANPSADITGKRPSASTEQSPSKKHASTVPEDVNYCPTGVTELAFEDADGRTEFYEKWSASSFISLGCIHTKGISNFRQLRVKVRTAYKANPETCELVGFGFYLDTGELYFLSMRSLANSSRSSVMQVIAPLLESQIPKICMNLQFFLESLFSALWVVDTIHCIDDPLLLAWVANTERDLSYNQLLVDFLELEKRTEDFLTEESATVNSVEIFYSDLQYCIGLFQIIEASMEKEEVDNYRIMEIPLCIQLCKTQMNGIIFDGTRLENTVSLVKEYIAALETAACKVAGVKELNITSTKQVAEVLFDKLGLPQEKNTKKCKKPSTSKDALLQIADKHPIIPLILDHRTTRSLLTAQMEPLLELWKNENRERKVNRLKCRWHLTNSPTGRVTTTKPNFQAMRNQGCDFEFPDGRKFSVNVRDCVKAPEGYSLVSFDYSQLELRILAHFCKDTTLVEFLESGKDVHSLIASRWLKKPVGKVTPSDRQSSKEICYGENLKVNIEPLIMVIRNHLWNESAHFSSEN